MIRRIPIFLAGAILVAGAWACDSLTDPAKSEPATTARVAGALTGDAPAGAHVAVVWRNVYGLTLGAADSPLVDGHFSIDLSPPPDELLTPVEGYGVDFSDAETVYPNQGSTFHQLTAVGGGTETGQPLRYAYAGFVVYVDTNGNGKLDFDKAGTVSDQLVGGSNGFALVYLRDGTTVDYEKLTGAHEGYNVRWENSPTPNRWWPLDQVPLALSPFPLPRSVCERMSAYNDMPSHYADDAGVEIRCDPSGNSYQPFLCSGQSSASALCETAYEHQQICIGQVPIAIDAGAPLPPEWPCVRPQE